MCPVRCPSTRRACTYGRSAAAPGASTTIRRPGPASTSACGNSGEPSTSSGTPGVCGYSPSADHTYQELIAPTSSLPGSPPGVALYSSVMMRRTVAWVCQGRRSVSYTYGVPNVGSLPCQWNGSLGPALSCAK